MPLGKFVSVTYPRRTGGERLDKNRMRMRALLFKMVDFVELFKMLQTAGSYGFKTLVDACDIVYRILPTLKSQQHITYSPLRSFDD